MSNVIAYDHFPVASRRTSGVSINALLNPEPEEQHSYTMSPSNPASPSNIDCYCNETSSPQVSSDDHITSQSMPASPISKNSSSSSPSTLAYNGYRTSINTEKAAATTSRRSSSAIPSSRRGSVNRTSGPGHAITSSDGNPDIITPPQTPGIKSPTKSNFAFPPNSNTANTSNDQSNNQPMPPKVKRKRITQEQLQDLVAMFDQTDTPSYDVREKLAKKLNMTNREVQVWFQNRRAKANRAKANEHNASHQHHRFLHHHSVSTAQAASGHASSIGMMPHGNFTFVPMFANGGPSTGGPARGRSNRRHSYVPPTNNNQKKVPQNTPHTRPRASTVTGVPMTTMSSHGHSIHVAPQQQQSNTPKMMVVPPPIKILPFVHEQRHVSGLGQSHHPVYGHPYAHSVPPSPISPVTPISPNTPILPPINYMLPSINNLTLPPPVAVPPIKELLAASTSDYQQSVYRQQETRPISLNNHQQSLSRMEYSDASTTKAVVNTPSEPSPIDLLAAAAELVQREKENECLGAYTENNSDQEDANNDKKWRPWVI
ncbi:7092_t:CDS:2 [Funneliformis geosporum]|uniref:19986_t:CDS:1 n=1 Tax=Funneliformis geosporum TaxID=1117311 RepID=A0A9W4WRR5_9GLOM|nr:19986_t:CDS:2 [Funneliformis geosporum]CAI2170535.1 7092_t:CDS:2 [Funneliformis geosporum]